MLGCVTGVSVRNAAQGRQLATYQSWLRRNMRRLLHTARGRQQLVGLLLSLSFCKTPRNARWTFQLVRVLTWCATQLQVALSWLVGWASQCAHATCSCRRGSMPALGRAIAPHRPLVVSLNKFQTVRRGCSRAPAKHQAAPISRPGPREAAQTLQTNSCRPNNAGSNLNRAERRAANLPIASAAAAPLLAARLLPQCQPNAAAPPRSRSAVPWACLVATHRRSSTPAACDVGDGSDSRGCSARPGLAAGRLGDGTGPYGRYSGWPGAAADAGCCADGGGHRPLCPHILPAPSHPPPHFRAVGGSHGCQRGHW